MGEGREGEAALRYQTVIARFPHLDPPPCWGRRNTLSFSNAIALPWGVTPFTCLPPAARVAAEKPLRAGLGRAQSMGSFIDVTAADGGRFKAYMTVPASGRGPGIVLCQEIFGVNAYVREVAELYAEEG